ncbi:MAG: hypothetical protein FK733_16955 [Asgard group archaeon]|nr:hypothetical protein [Asgard group archaeon]
MKCCYDPDLEAEGSCVNCNVPLCKTCLTDAELGEGLCQACIRQKRIFKFYQIFRITSCTLGVGWAVLAFIVIDAAKWTTNLSYGLLGVVGAFGLNMLVLVLLSRMLLVNLKPHQKVFVALARYSVSGNKVFFTQAIRAMKKVDNMELYKDALFDQLVSILILQSYDLPLDWITYFCDNFKLTKEELLDGILKFGIDVFEENIFHQDHYRAIEPYIEVIKEAEREDLYHKLIDQILDRLNNTDIKAAMRPPPITYQPMPGQQGTQQAQPQAQRESPAVIRDRAFLTELKLIDEELKEFLVKSGRDKDWEKLNEVIAVYELPKVPKSTIDAARLMATKTQTQMKGPDGIVGTADDLGDPSKVKICAECGNTFTKDQLMSYTFRDISVNVCRDCNQILEKDGHREPRLLASIRKPKEHKKLKDEAEDSD